MGITNRGRERGKGEKREGRKEEKVWREDRGRLAGWLVDLARMVKEKEGRRRRESVVRGVGELV